MRSELVTGALRNVPNRFLLTRLAAKAIRALHRPHARVADTANDVFFRFSVSDPVARRPQRSNPRMTEPQDPRRVALRRAS